MASTRQLTRLLYWGLALGGFTFIFVISLIINAPASYLNHILKEQNIELVGLTGNIHGGRFNQLAFAGKNYSLSCQYQRLQILEYQLSCQSPLRLHANVSLGLTGDIAVSKAEISGEIDNAKDWMRLLQIPDGISGEIFFVIERIKISKMVLRELALQGSAEVITFYDQPVLKNIRVSTQSQHEPIVLETSTEGEVRVFLETKINANQYETTGTIKGQNLQDYASLLDFFGQRVSLNEWMVNMQGRVLP